MIEAIKKMNNPDTFKITLASLDQKRGRWWYRSTFFGVDGGLIIIRFGFDQASVDGVNMCMLYMPKLTYQVGECVRTLYPCEKTLGWHDSLYDALVDVVKQVFLYS